MVERYPMCKDQPAQIDCRVTDCSFYSGGGQCSNVSPAITLNPDRTYVCWSRSSKAERVSSMWRYAVLEIYQLTDGRGGWKPWPDEGGAAEWIHKELVTYSQGRLEDLVVDTSLLKLLLWKFQGWLNPKGEG